MLFNSLTKVVHISLKAPEIGTSRFNNPKLEPSQTIQSEHLSRGPYLPASITHFWTWPFSSKSFRDAPLAGAP
jgi:hypothetical protein